MTNAILIALTILMFCVLCFSVKRNMKLSNSLNEADRLARTKADEFSKLHESWLKQAANLAEKNKELSEVNAELFAAQSQISACNNAIGEQKALVESLRNDILREQLDKDSLRNAIGSRDKRIVELIAEKDAANQRSQMYLNAANKDHEELVKANAELQSLKAKPACKKKCCPVKKAAAKRRSDPNSITHS